MVKVKHNKKETQRRSITKYANSITATEGLTQPCEFVDFTFLIAFREWEWATRAAIHWAFSPCSPVPSSLTFSHSQVTLPGSTELQQVGVMNPSRSSPLSWKLGRQSKAVLPRIASICQTWLWVSCHPSAACSPWAEQSHLRQGHVFLSGWLVLVERTATRAGKFLWSSPQPRLLFWLLAGLS